MQVKIIRKDFGGIEWTDDSKDKAAEKEYGKDHPDEDYKNRIGWGMTDIDMENRFESYMNEHGITVDFIYTQDKNPNAFFKEKEAIPPTIDNYNKWKNEGVVYLSAYEGSKFYPVDKSETMQKLEGGHIVTITGVTDNGRFIVSTWGSEYTIDPKDVENGSIQMVKYYE